MLIAIRALDGKGCGGGPGRRVVGDGSRRPSGFAGQIQQTLRSIRRAGGDHADHVIVGLDPPRQSRGRCGGISHHVIGRISGDECGRRISIHRELPLRPG